ncbi:MAG: GNAT family N-acetyltransferase [Hyphomonadaceae bacterium]
MDDGPMIVELFRYADLDAETLAALVEIRDADPSYDSPFFAVEFARQLSLVRDDTRIAVIRDANGIAGYWAMHVRPDKWARPIGAAFSDWHGPVFRSGVNVNDADDLLGAAGLKGMTVNGLQVDAAGNLATGEIVGVGQAHLENGDAEAFLINQRQRFPKYGKNIRRAERLIEKEFGGMSFTADDRSTDALDWLLARKSAQYKMTGLHDVLAPDWVQRFMRNLHSCRTPRFGGRLSTLRFGDSLVAAELDLISDTIVHGWITVFDNDYARYSPGHLLIKEIICDMPRTGHVVTDMGAGDSAYKKYYETYVLPSHSGVVRSDKGLRPLAGSWRLAERVFPEKISLNLAKIRRRTDQIVGTDLDSGARVSGFLAALSGRRANK